MRRGAFAGLALGVSILGGCQAGAESAPNEASVTDSAGVSIVRNTAGDRTLAVTEVLRMGVVEGDPNLLFHRVRSLAVTPAGDIWVADSNESVRHYSSAGAYVGSVGRQGEGPGEASRGYGAVWVGEGFVGALAAGADIQVFSFDGTYRTSRPSRTASGSFTIPLAPRGHGWTLHLLGFEPVSESRAQRTWTIAAGGLGDGPVDTLLELPGEAMTGMGAEWTRNSYFEGRPSLAADEEGDVYVSDPREYRIEYYDASGDLKRIVQRDVAPAPYPTGLEDAVAEGIRAEWGARGQPSDENMVQRMVARALPSDPPEHLPFLQSLFVSRDGYLWALRADLHPRPAMRAVAGAFGFIRSVWPEAWRAPVHFDLFTPEGHYRGSVELPSEFVPLTVTRGRVYGTEFDELEVERVVAYEIRP